MFAPAFPATPAQAESRPFSATESELNPALAVFMAERTRLFRVALRIVGNVGAAEEVVQETWVRWQRTDRDQIENPAAFLTTATTHLAINVIQSAWHRRETTNDSILADLLDPTQDPMAQAEQQIAVERALGLLMARLTSTELAAYVLRKGFDYPYREIGQVLRTSTPNARQLVRRAQRSITIGRARKVDRADHHRVVRTFMAAARTGNMATLERVLMDVAAHPGVHGPR
jgi:RNA polymerase sigma factor (sigma-70 family)